MKYPHFAAALAALALAALALAAGVVYVSGIENQYLYALAARNFSQKRNGVALQDIALHTGDLLPVYGSSELNLKDPFTADRIFRLQPTGFNVFTIAGDGAEPLTYLQMLGGMGDQLKGKRVVISLSPQFFLESKFSQEAFLANFSRLHLYRFLLGDVPLPLKQKAARRLLDYPIALNRDPFLNQLVTLMADPSWQSRALFLALMPYAKLQQLVLELQDHWAILQYIRNHPDLQPDVARREQNLNWDLLHDHAETYALAHATNNPFGILNEEWTATWSAYAAAHRADMTDDDFARVLAGSHGWSDLNLLLESLNALGAKPLLISLPLHVDFWQYRGVSSDALNKYYDRLRATAARQNVPVVTFQEFASDKYFLRDPGAHMSAMGWVSYSRILDAFFNNRPLAYQ